MIEEHRYAIIFVIIKFCILTVSRHLTRCLVAIVTRMPGEFAAWESVLLIHRKAHCMSTD